MRGKVQVFTMFKNKPTVVFEEPVLKNNIRKIPGILKVEGRISKDQIVLAAGKVPDGLKYICPHGLYKSQIHFPNMFKDVGVVDSVNFNKLDLCASAGSKFQTDTACSGKQIQDRYVRNAEIILNNVEQAFPGKVCCRPCTQAFREREAFAPECSAYDTQEYRFSRFRKA